MGKELISSAPASWTIRLYRPGDEEQILSLFRRVFGIKHSADYWVWKFGENPLGHQIVLGATPDETVIAHIAGVPLRVQLEGNPLVFTLVVDLMVDPGYRRSLRKVGVYQALLGTLIETSTGAGRAAVLYGIPIRSSNRLPQALFRWREAYEVTRLVRPLGPSTGGRLSRLARWRYEVRPVRDFGGWMDRFWQSCAPEFPLATVRDARYMNWRYIRCPHIAYHPYMLWDRWLRRPRGVAVLRLEWQGQPTGCLVDWLVPRGDVEAVRVLLAGMEEVVRQHGLQELSAWFPPDSPERRLFMASGYREEAMGSALIGNVYTTSLTWDWVARHWYFTMGDSDIF